MSLNDIANTLIRIEDVSNDEMNEQMIECTHAVYPHALIYGVSFTLEQYIKVSVDEVFAFLRQLSNIEQWSYAYRHCSNNGDTVDSLEDKLTQQRWLCQISAYASANVIDLRWQDSDSKQLLMHDSIRIIDAQSALNKPGTVILWNCSHTPLENNVTHLHDMVRAGWWQDMPGRRKLELNNIKLLLEHQANK